MGGGEGKSLSVAEIVLNISSPGRSRRGVASEPLSVPFGGGVQLSGGWQDSLGGSPFVET